MDEVYLARVREKIKPLVLDLPGDPYPMVRLFRDTSLVDMVFTPVGVVRGNSDTINVSMASIIPELFEQESIKRAVHAVATDSPDVVEELQEMGTFYERRGQAFYRHHDNHISYRFLDLQNT